MCGQCYGRNMARKWWEQRRDKERSPARASFMEELIAEPSLEGQVGTTLAKGRLWGEGKDIQVDKKQGHVNRVEGYK